MRTFIVARTEDPSGVSGTGIVAEGVEWADGTVTMRWLDRGRVNDGRRVRPTTVIHDDIESVEALHSHGGVTTIVWNGGESGGVLEDRVG